MSDELSEESPVDETEVEAQIPPAVEEEISEPLPEEELEIEVEQERPALIGDD